MNENTWMATSQTILHDCLTIMGDSTYGFFGLLQIARTRDGEALNINVSLDGQKVFDVKAMPYDGKNISFEGTRYATPNIHGFKVVKVYRLNKGQWVDKLHERAKEKTQPVKDDRFESIDDSKYWNP